MSGDPETPSKGRSTQPSKQRNNGAPLLLSQVEVVSRYVSILVHHTLTWKNQNALGLQDLFIKSSVTNQLRSFWLEVSTVIQRCSSRYACKCISSHCARSHTIVPCGSLFQSSKGQFQTSHELRVPFGFHINITLLYILGHAYTRDCYVTQSLTVTEIVGNGRENVENTICGKTPVQNFYSTTSRVRITWYSRIPYETESGYCLIYDAVALGQVNLIDTTHNTKMQVRQICELHPNKCERFHLLSLRGPPLSFAVIHGEKWIFVWSFVGDVLKTPTVKIHSFRCGRLRSLFPSASRLSRLEVTDGPVSVHDNHFMPILFLSVLSQSCKDPLSKESFTGSIGDITVRAIWNSWQRYEVKISFHLANLTCLSHQACSQEQRQISKQESISVFSSNRTSQNRLLVAVEDGAKEFIELRDMIFHYDGLGHLPCVTGGIFIYELNPVSLVTRICSLWTSVIWS